MNNNEYLEKEKKLSIQEKALSKMSWECMCPHCCEKAINSHLLQRHGILDYIVEQGHLYELSQEDIFKWHEKEPIRVRKVGLQQAISYPLFCNRHDTQLFSSIEGDTIEFDDYHSQLLFSYRGLCSEIRKKEFNEVRMEAWSDGDFKNLNVKGTRSGLKDLYYYKYLLEKEMVDLANTFTFYHISFPLLKICASGSISYEPVNYDSELSVENAFKKKVWDSVFINVIPQQSSLELIMGYHNNHANSDLRKYVESWIDLNFEQLQFKLTDLFATKLESWCMSPSLYENLNQEKKAWLMNTIKNISLDFCYDLRNETNFNLFG